MRIGRLPMSGMTTNRDIPTLVFFKAVFYSTWFGPAAQAPSPMWSMWSLEFRSAH